MQKNTVTTITTYYVLSLPRSCCFCVLISEHAHAWSGSCFAGRNSSACAEKGLVSVMAERRSPHTHSHTDITTTSMPTPTQHCAHVASQAQSSLVLFGLGSSYPDLAQQCAYVCFTECIKHRCQHSICHRQQACVAVWHLCHG